MTKEKRKFSLQMKFKLFHMDDTGMKHKEKSHLHVICNFLFSVFFIELEKDSKPSKKFFWLNK